MKSSLVDKTGMKFGRLTVISRADNAADGGTRWLCKCDCGNYKIIRSANLWKGSTTSSCGCYKKETLVSKAKEKAENNRKQMIGTRLHRIWKGIIWRCACPSNSVYKNYGGRGIKICEEWENNFFAFRDWSLEHGYSDDLTIDRINNDGDYTPDNCRWATMKTQDNNKRNNHYIKCNSEKLTIAEWSERIGSKDRHAVLDRIEKGWTVEDAVTIPIGILTNEIFVEINGVTKNVSQWAYDNGILPDTAYKRIKSGWSPIKAVTTPARKIKRRGGVIVGST